MRTSHMERNKEREREREREGESMSSQRKLRFYISLVGGGGSERNQL